MHPGGSEAVSMRRSGQPAMFPDTGISRSPRFLRRSGSAAPRPRGRDLPGFGFRNELIGFWIHEARIVGQVRHLITIVPKTPSYLITSVWTRASGPAARTWSMMPKSAGSEGVGDDRVDPRASSFFEREVVEIHAAQSGRSPPPLFRDGDAARHAASSPLRTRR